MSRRNFVTIGMVLGLATQALAQSAAPSEQLDEAQAIVSRGERLSSRVAAMMTEAQREKDIIRVNCLDDKLAQVNANIRTAKARVDVLGAQTDPGLRSQAMTVMMVLGQKFDVLEQEASQCIGQNIFETGTTLLETQVDSAVVPTDEEANSTIVPELIPPPQSGEVVTEIPAPPEEASGKS